MVSYMPLVERDFKKIEAILEKRNVNRYYIKRLLNYIRELNKYVDISGLLLYGSVARGNPIYHKSDIDIIVISEDFKNYNEIFNLRREISRFLPSGIDSMWMNKNEFEAALLGLSGVILDALYEGIILYDRDGFLENMKQRLLKAIKRGEIERYKNFWRFPKVKIGKRTKIEI